jgi:tetratricopeptide (TPR) repeat protein
MAIPIPRPPGAAAAPFLALAMGLVLELGLGLGPAGAVNNDQLMQLLTHKTCQGCKLQDADLVHADLRDAQLQRAQLQRANLGRAQLDGANLSGADLSFSSLLGASLRGANLRGTKLEGTDLRDADLSGAQLDTNALATSHWKGAIGVGVELSSYAALHNAGVEAALEGRLPEAEKYFNQALLKQPDAAITWLARGITRVEQAKREEGVQDFIYAASLYERQGAPETALELRREAEQLNKGAKKPAGGNGMGGTLLQGAAGLFQVLAPLAAKALIPLPF